MAAEHEEELESLKKWWAENGRSVIVGIVLGVGGLVGWNGWQSYKAKQAASASEHYATVIKAVRESNAETVADNVDVLQKSYASTPYAALGALDFARQLALAGELHDAELQLRWAIDHSPQEVVRDVASLRLARVLLELDKPAEALTLVSSEFPPSYNSLIDEIRGDALLAMGKTDEARAAYDKALAGGTGNMDYLRMKREDLGAPDAS